MIATVGDLLEDVVVWASEGFQVGTDTAARIARTRGGSAANVAAMAVACGGRARFIGNVGADELGDRLLDQLRGLGVDVAVRRSGHTGSLVAIITTDGERSFFTDRGSATALDSFDPSWLDGCRALHVPAYSFDGEPMATTATQLVGAARAAGLVVSVDCSSTSIVARMGVEAFRGLLERLAPSVVLANRDEAGLVGLGPERPAPGAGTTIVREGGDQTWVVSSDGSTVAVPVPPVADVVDTTGAGDAFAAGWLLAILAGASPVEATDEGHRVAARVLTGAGATVAGPWGGGSWP